MVYTTGKRISFYLIKTCRKVYLREFCPVGKCIRADCSNAIRYGNTSCNTLCSKQGFFFIFIIDDTVFAAIRSVRRCYGNDSKIFASPKRIFLYLIKTCRKVYLRKFCAVLESCPTNFGNLLRYDNACKFRTSVKSALTDNGYVAA